MGIELDDATSLVIPENVPKEYASKMKEALPGIAELMRIIKNNILKNLEDLMQDERVPIPVKTPNQIPKSGPKVILDEAAALITTGSDEALEGDLDLVLAGIAVQLKSSEDPNAVNIGVKLMERLPAHREKVIESLRTLCSTEQLKKLQES